MEQSYPVQVRARFDEPLSRWLWLVKWLLAIPHYAIVTVFAGGAAYTRPGPPGTRGRTMPSPAG